MRIISPYSDWLVEYDVTRPASTTGEDEVAIGLVSLTGRLSATRGGAALDPSLSVTLVERSAKPGRYYGVIDRAYLTTVLVALIGHVIYEVVDDTSNLKRTEPLRVVAELAPA